MNGRSIPFPHAFDLDRASHQLDQAAEIDSPRRCRRICGSWTHRLREWTNSRLTTPLTYRHRSRDIEVDEIASICCRQERFDDDFARGVNLIALLHRLRRIAAALRVSVTWSERWDHVDDELDLLRIWPGSTWSPTSSTQRRRSMGSARCELAGFDFWKKSRMSFQNSQQRDSLERWSRRILCTAPASIEAQFLIPNTPFIGVRNSVAHVCKEIGFGPRCVLCSCIALSRSAYGPQSGSRDPGDAHPPRCDIACRLEFIAAGREHDCQCPIRLNSRSSASWPSAIRFATETADPAAWSNHDHAPHEIHCNEQGGYGRTATRVA